MNREEQQLIEDLFARLRNYGGDGGKDPEAESLIGDLVRRSPDAPYYLAQTVIIQQQALERAEVRMRELEEAAARPPQYTARGGSFLSGASVPASGSRFGAAARQPQRAPDDMAPPPTSPWASPAQRGGGTGSFLSSALSTAAGVAGGVFLADGIRSLFGGGSSAQAAGGTSASDQMTIDHLQDEAQDARDDADQAQKDLAADDAELDRMQDAQDDDAEDTWADDDGLDI
jgi:uncharacterized protein